MSTPDVKELLIETFRAPKDLARRLIAMNLPLQARLIALGAVVAASAALGTLAEILFAFITKIDLGAVGSPLPMAVVQGVLILYGAFAMVLVGGWFGGRGRYADALLLMVWIEFVLMVAQIAQVLIMVFFPLTSVVVSLAVVGLLFWLLVQFTAALHGFTEMVPVAFGVIATFFVSALIAGVLLVSLGIVPVPVAGAGA